MLCYLSQTGHQILQRGHSQFTLSTFISDFAIQTNTIAGKERKPIDACPTGENRVSDISGDGRIGSARMRRSTELAMHLR
jgi:hypothetical protein